MMSTGQTCMPWAWADQAPCYRQICYETDWVSLAINRDVWRGRCCGVGSVELKFQVAFLLV